MTDVTRSPFALVPTNDPDVGCSDDAEREEYAWCWIACPHDPPCADAPRASDPKRDE